MKMLREIMNALPNTVEDGLVWIAKDPWAQSVHEGENSKAITLEMKETLAVFEQFMSGDRVC